MCLGGQDLKGGGTIGSTLRRSRGQIVLFNTTLQAFYTFRLPKATRPTSAGLPTTTRAVLVLDLDYHATGLPRAPNASPTTFQTRCMSALFVAIRRSATVTAKHLHRCLYLMAAWRRFCFTRAQKIASKGAKRTILSVSVCPP